MSDYQLSNGLVQADAPKEVGSNTGHFWFSSLHRIGQDILVCAIIRSADVGQGKWPADLYLSTDAGTTWQLDRRIDSYGHTSIGHDPSTTLMMPYEVWPLTPQDKVNCVAEGTLLTLSADGSLAAEARQVRFRHFPAPLAQYHEDELFLLHSGNILPLANGQLFTTLYGKFEGNKHFCSFGVVSDDNGFSWQYRSTIAPGDTAPGAPEGPNESDSQVLDNGALLCIFRVADSWDFYKTYSQDQGHSWSAPLKMEGMGSVQPRLAKLGNGALILIGGRPGLYMWLCTDGEGHNWEAVNLGTHHNQQLEAQEQHFSDAFCQGQKGDDPALSTSYTGIMPWGEDGVIVTYDRLSNGWSGAPGPNGKVDRVFSLSLKVSV